MTDEIPGSEGFTTTKHEIADEMMGLEGLSGGNYEIGGFTIRRG
jgi:hypothetical protein